jgi:hypothetical protein
MLLVGEAVKKENERIGVITLSQLSSTAFLIYDETFTPLSPSQNEKK